MTRRATLAALTALALPLARAAAKLPANRNVKWALGSNLWNYFPRVPFTDITEAAGIKFKHVNGAFGKKLLPETMGSGVAFLDFDNDGKQDLLFINSRPWPGDSSGPVPTMALYRNKGDGTFEDVTEKMGLNVPLYGMGVTVGDFDNDGWVDIFVTAIGGCKLFRNDGGKRFVDVTAEAGVGGGGVWPGASFRSSSCSLSSVSAARVGPAGCADFA